MVTILGANSVSGYNITNSLRLDDGSNSSLAFTAAAGNRQIFTLSFWVKRSNLPDAGMKLFDAGTSTDADDGRFLVSFTGAGKLQVVGGATTFRTTNRQFRDPSAWYHIVIAVDTTDGTAANRLKIYVNGVQESSFADNNAVGENLNTPVNNNNNVHAIGHNQVSGNEHFDGYITEYYLIDGAQKAPTDFGETDDNGVWIPALYTGSFGTNGFKLIFSQTGTSANASGIGADISGTGTHFGVTNLAAIDIGTDTPTNNFCTLNSLDIDSTLPTLAEGNLDYHSANGTAFNPVRSTFAVTKGKWYAEWKYINTAGFLGVISTQSPLTGNIASDADVRSILRIPAGLYAGRNNSGGFTDVGDNSQTFSDDDIGQVALDMDNGFVYFGINGTYLKGQDGSTTGDPAGNNGGAGGSANHPSQLMTAQHDGAIAFMAGDFTQNTTGQIQCNFGGGAPFAISSGNTDGEGHGNFEFAPPTGFFALCTKNLGKYG